MFGFSFYPFYGTNATLVNLEDMLDMLDTLATSCGRPLRVVETDWPDSCPGGGDVEGPD